MGILNVTPDSFSDGGCYHAPRDALVQAQAMVEEGAAIIDVGGESTRPGAMAVSVEEQIRRVVPIIEALQAFVPAGIALSVDTRSHEVARAALDAGATMVNDVAAGADPGMLPLVAERGARVVLMHMQGTPETMQDAPHYDDVGTEVHAFLRARADAAVAAGVQPDNILIDPGIGFGKRKQDNLALIATLDKLVASGFAVLLGTSRKRFMGSICREARFSELVGATCATTTLGVMAGVQVFRVHDVKENRQAMEVAWAILNQR